MRKIPFGSNSRPNVSEGYVVTSELPGRHSVAIFSSSNYCLNNYKYYRRVAEMIRSILFYSRSTVSMHVWSLLLAGWASNGYDCQPCSWSGEQGKSIFPCPRSRLRICSREIGSTVLSGVSSLILPTCCTQAESAGVVTN